MPSFKNNNSPMPFMGSTLLSILFLLIFITCVALYYAIFGSETNQQNRNDETSFERVTKEGHIGKQERKGVNKTYYYLKKNQQVPSKLEIESESSELVFEASARGGTKVKEIMASVTGSFVENHHFRNVSAPIVLRKFSADEVEFSPKAQTCVAKHPNWICFCKKNNNDRELLEKGYAESFTLSLDQPNDSFSFNDFSIALYNCEDPLEIEGKKGYYSTDNGNTTVFYATGDVSLTFQDKLLQCGAVKWDVENKSGEFVKEIQDLPVRLWDRGRKLMAQSDLMFIEMNDDSFNNFIAKDNVIVHRENYVLYSDQVVGNLIQCAFDFESPYGVLQQEEGDPILFSSEKLLWSIPEGRCHLKGKGWVKQQHIGTFSSNEQIFVEEKKNEEGKPYYIVESFGQSLFEGSRSSSNLPFSLKCQGHFKLDSHHKKLSLESSSCEKGNYSNSKQIQFRDYVGEIDADTAHIDFCDESGKMGLEKIVLSGNVRLLNRSLENDRPYHQIAIASDVHYDPKSCQMILAGTDEARVLLVDRLNRLKVSAPKLQIQRDAITKKDSIKGVGDTRFHFLKHEFDELKKHFLFERDPNDA